MKKKRFHVADDTILDCSSVNYKYNRDTYKVEKLLFMVVAIIGAVVSFLVILINTNTVVQTIAGAFLGGILSLIVWLLTIRQQDKINYEIANIDLHIMYINNHRDYQNSKVRFIDPEDDEIVQVDSDNIVYRFMHLLTLAMNLNHDENIDTSRLLLKWIDEKEYPLEQYIRESEKICMNHFLDLFQNEKKWDKVIAKNNYIIDWKLDDLEKKLQRYKMYILCGNAPTSFDELKLKKH